MDDILDFIESVSEGFSTYSSMKDVGNEECCRSDS